MADKSPHRKVRSATAFAVAAVTRATGDEAAAERLFEKFRTDFDGRTEYRYQGIEQMYRQMAEAELADIRRCGVGRSAPALAGTDLDGRPLKLADFRGKVVLVSFWSTTCGPCLKLVPHERELAERLVGKPFAVVGVNQDRDPAAAKRVAADHRMSWPSFRDEEAVRGAWPVGGLPTLYLLDHTGVVRRRWASAPDPADLGRAVEELVGKAERP